MATNRRTFIKSVTAVGSAIGLAGVPRLALGQEAESEPVWTPKPVGKARVPLNILILGGTGFTGPEQVEYAIARGHRVTLFNRNKTRPGAFKGKVAEELVGDLNNDTTALQGKKFDVVIDNPTTAPAWVRNAAKFLAGNVKHYIFVSTTSTYSDQSIIGLNESSPTVVLREGVDPYSVDPQVIGGNYGGLKVLAEKEVQKQYPEFGR